jgi:cytochrome oxidase Cu insertion factor (SCO1/SenC/PrrC family)
MGGCGAVQELRLVDRDLGTTKNRVELVAIDTNPRYLNPDDLGRFDGHLGLNRVGNWLFLTGPLPKLSNVLSDFGVYLDRGYMMGLPHGQVAYVIDGSGRTREVLSIGDRGSASKAMESSVAAAIATAVERVASFPVSPQSYER